VASSPNVQVLHDQFSNDPGVSVLAVHYDDSSDAAAYLAKHGYTFPTITSGSEVAKSFDVAGLPTFVVVGRDGRIIFRQAGRMTDELRDTIYHLAIEASASSR
jgi:hypothetical protein